VRTESKKISANRNQRGRSKKKTNQKKRTNVADTRKIEGKKTACNAQKGAEKDEREREKERREGYSHISVSIQIFLYPSSSSKCERGGETKERRCSTPNCIFSSIKQRPGFFLCIFSSLLLA
jgi:hypothetical protein